MRKSFTLIELLVVLLILSIIVGLVVPIGNKFYESFNKKIINLETKNKEILERFDAFMRETNNSKFNKYGIKIEKIIFSN